MINDEVLSLLTKIQITRELDLEPNLVFRALLSNRIQDEILMPFVDKLSINQAEARLLDCHFFSSHRLPKGDVVVQN